MGSWCFCLNCEASTQSQEPGAGVPGDIGFPKAWRLAEAACRSGLRHQGSGHPAPLAAPTGCDAGRQGRGLSGTLKDRFALRPRAWGRRRGGPKWPPAWHADSSSAARSDLPLLRFSPWMREAANSSPLPSRPRKLNLGFRLRKSWYVHMKLFRENLLLSLDFRSHSLLWV